MKFNKIVFSLILLIETSFFASACKFKKACQVYATCVDIYNVQNPEAKVVRPADEVSNYRVKADIEQTLHAKISYPFIAIDETVIEAKVNPKTGNVALTGLQLSQDFIVLQAVAKMNERKFVPGKLAADFDIVKASMIPGGLCGNCTFAHR